MKRLMLFFLGVLSAGIFAQNQRFTYEYKYAIDSLKKDSIQTELTNLDVSKTGSVYYSAAKQQSDSIFNVASQMAFRGGATS